MNPESLDTLPLVIMTWALASTRVPSAKALKEAILPKPTETSAPRPKLPAILAQNLEPCPIPAFNPKPIEMEPLT